MSRESSTSLRFARNDKDGQGDKIADVNILIAPDKFKGSLNAREVAENIVNGLRDALPDAKIEIVSMADGGEGTAEAICDARHGSWLKCKAHDPLGREIEARYGWIESGKIAVMEMSEAAGMRRVSEEERDPLRATTFGVGEMILDAANRGVRVRLDAQKKGAGERATIGAHPPRAAAWWTQSANGQLSWLASPRACPV